MSKQHSTRTRKPAKPEKPDGVPLTPRPTGRWCNKIRGQLHYFGYWCGPDVGDDFVAAAK